MSGIKKEKGNICNDQKIAIVEYMETHSELKSGKFSNDFTFKTAQKMWEELSNILNAIPEVRKDWKQWRKTWQDLRQMRKQKKSKVIKHQRGTGGGCPSDEILTPVEDRIVDLIGTTAIEGHSDINESATNFNFNEVSSIKEALNQSGILLTDIAVPTTISSDTDIPTTHSSVSFASTITPAEPLSSTPLPSLPPKQPMTPRQRQGLQRLKNTIAATARLADATDKKLKLKEDYYKSKLQLYKRDVIAKDRIATALEKISYKFKK